MTKVTITAWDKRKGMDLHELAGTVQAARQSGWKLVRTRVGLRGQIMEMIFSKPHPEGKNDFAPGPYSWTKEKE